MKIIIKVLLFALCHQILLMVQSEMVLRVTNLGCMSSNKTITDFKCFIKSYQQNLQTFNGFISITRMIYKCKVSYCKLCPDK